MTLTGPPFPPDTARAVAAIKRAAVSQPHTVRKLMQRMASIFGGINLPSKGYDNPEFGPVPAIVIISISVAVDGDHMGYVDLNISFYPENDFVSVSTNVDGAGLRIM